MTEEKGIENLDDLPQAEAAEIVAHATEARVRRAPKLRSFFLAGALGGIAVGIVVSLIAFAISGNYEAKGSTLLWFSTAFGALGTLLAGGLAARADRRS